MILLMPSTEEIQLICVFIAVFFVVFVIVIPVAIKLILIAFLDLKCDCHSAPADPPPEGESYHSTSL